MKDEPRSFRDRVRSAAQAALEQGGSVGPLELFQHMLLLQPVHFEGWRKGNEHFRPLEPWIQVGPEKFQKTLRYFAEWVQESALRPIEVPYTSQSRGGVEQLQVTADGAPEREKFYRTRYVPAELSEKKTAALSRKLAKTPDLVVFEKVSQEGNCADCGVELFKGNFLTMEKGKPLCLRCADLDHLVFLPAGDTALSRRSRKYSSLSAVVVRFSRTRRRYERQGLLVTAAALARAEEECVADAPERAARRAQGAIERRREDHEFIQAMTRELQALYPGCPASEAQTIAEHTAQRGSGRVGRSAAGRALERQALELAVRAHIRHEHTKYDELLMEGIERLAARAQVRHEIDRVLASWATH